MFAPVAGLLLLAQAPGGLDAKAVTVEAPTRVTEIDTGKLKGEPTRLSWSPDGSQLHLQTTEVKSGAPVHRHHIFAIASSKLQAVDSEPDWAGRYWAWKSAQAAPGAPAFKIALDSEKRLLRSTNVPRGSGVAGMGGDPGAGGTSGPGPGGGLPPPAIGETQNATVHRMLLRGEVVGEWVNAPIVPGQTFGWSPLELGLIAYATRDGHLVIMDGNGGRNEVAGTSDVLLPAWSEDGSKIAFLKKSSRRKYDLLIADVRR